MDIHRCFIPDSDKKVAKFPSVKNKALVNALSYMVITPRHTYRFDMNDDAKIGLLS
jgi:hypothetical protein